MINQEFEAQERKYQVLPNFGICCRELRGRGEARSYEFSRMRAQFQLCRWGLSDQILGKFHVAPRPDHCKEANLDLHISMLSSCDSSQL